MNNEQLLTRLAEANAYREDAPLPEAIWTQSLALREIERRTDMQTRDTTLRETETKPSRRRNGLLVAAAAFVAVLIVGVVFSLTSGGDETGPATNETTPPTTEAAPTSVAPTTTVAFSTTAVPVVLAAIDARNRGDMDAYLESLAGTELLLAQGALSQLSVIMGYANEQTELVDCQVTGIYLAGESIVECGVIWTNDFYGAGGITETGTATFYVTEADKIDNSLDVFDDENVDWPETNQAKFNVAFFTWLMDAHPTVFDAIGPIPGELFNIPGFDNPTFGDPHEPEEMLTALEYVAEFVAQSDVYPLTP